jgi:hypothetical protein
MKSSSPTHNDVKISVQEYHQDDQAVQFPQTTFPIILSFENHWCPGTKKPAGSSWFEFWVALYTFRQSRHAIVPLTTAGRKSDLYQA